MCGLLSFVFPFAYMQFTYTLTCGVCSMDKPMQPLDVFQLVSQVG